MSSDLREHDVREFLSRMADEMPAPPTAPQIAVRRARGKLARNAVAGTLAGVVVVLGAISGVQAIIDARPPEGPAVETPRPPVVAIPIDRLAPHVAVGEGSVWVVGDAVTRVDPTVDRVVARIRGQSSAAGFPVAIGEGAVWVSGGAFDGEVIRIDPATNDIVATIHSGTYDDPYALAVGEGAVWATHRRGEALMRIDAATDEPTAFPIPWTAVHGVTVLDGTVWIVAGDDRDGNGELHGIDPASGAIVGHIPVLVHDRVSTGFGSLWAFASVESSIVRVDPSSRSVAASFDIGFRGREDDADLVELAIGADAVWVSLTRYGAGDDVEARILRIDPQTNEIAGEYVLDAPAAGLAAGEGAVWVSDGLGTLYRIDPGAFVAPAEAP